MSDEEQNQNADAGEKEILEQAQGAAAEEQEAVSSLEEELLKWRDSAMRTAAEYDNYRKRMVKEKEECAKFANQRLLEAAEKAKVELSGMTETEINLPYITADASGKFAGRRLCHRRRSHRAQQRVSRHRRKTPLNKGRIQRRDGGSPPRPAVT